MPKQEPSKKQIAIPAYNTFGFLVHNSMVSDLIQKQADFEMDCYNLAKQENITFEQAKEQIIEYRKTHI